MDHELPDEDRKKIKEIAVSHESVRGVHDIRTRTSGLKIFIQLHLELDNDISLVDSHKIADAVERLINVQYPNAEILIHQDPMGVKEKVAVFH
jgi:ferrous-iron efflux pump FieF